jgi:molybdopterin synthase sulfur carrier subunit
MSKVYIKVFAVLKDHLDEEFTISKSLSSIADLKKELSIINPTIQNLLESCRFAVDNSFIDNTFQLKENDTVYIMPPSSGG